MSLRKYKAAGTSKGKKECKMPDCKLLSTCPYFNDATQDMYEMAELYKKRYCKGEYTWCGRHMVLKTLQRELLRRRENVTVY